MFSALKKLAKVGEDRNQSAPSPMSSSLQKKFSKGVHYNMKILIKGDRNVGKSCLLQRLQGGPFMEEYRPTDQIQAAPIHWAYHATDHIVKVEVWEVVDKGRAKKKVPLALKFENQSAGSEQDTETPMLDATFLDVYKDANGVILMMDITKPWTFEYVQKELRSIPADLPVVVLGNHCDMNHHRQIHPHHIEELMETVKDKRTGTVRYAEASMRNGFGLRFLHKFLSVPFLRLQRASLLQQLERNQTEAQQAQMQLDQYQSSEECDYSLFVERIAAKRREHSASVAPPSSLAMPPNVATPTPARSIVLGAGMPIVPPHINPLVAASLNPAPTSPGQPTTSCMAAEQRSYVSPILTGTRAHLEEAKSRLLSPDPPHRCEGGITTDPLEDFYSGTLEKSFLDEASPPVRVGGLVYSNVHNDSDEENTANPMVSAVEDDIEDCPEPTNKIYQTQTPQKSDIYRGRKNGPIFRGQSGAYVLKSAQYHQQSFNNQNELCSQSGLMVQDGTSEEDFVVMERLSLYEKGQRSSDEGNITSTTGIWPSDVSIRRSPEGVEDPESNKEKQFQEHKDKKHKKSKKSKDKEHDKARYEKPHRSSLERAERRERKQREKAATNMFYDKDEEMRAPNEYAAL